MSFQATGGFTHSSLCLHECAVPDFIAQIAYSDLNPGIAIRGPLQQCQKFFTESAKVVQLHTAYLITSGDQVIHALTCCFGVH